MSVSSEGLNTTPEAGWNADAADDTGWRWIMRLRRPDHPIASVAGGAHKCRIPGLTMTRMAWMADQWMIRWTMVAPTAPPEVEIHSSAVSPALSGKRIGSSLGLVESSILYRGMNVNVESGVVSVCSRFTIPTAPSDAPNAKYDMPTIIVSGCG